jgi:tRNA pseudouridine55 synthase
MDAVLVINKPLGPTSHDVVAVVRRAIGLSRIGHTGTLDPLASGVLPLVIGQATRLASLMSGADKEYLAKVRFGVATDTYDAEHLASTGGSGATPEATAVVAGLDRAALLAALPAFSGRYQQTPPAFSAKKIAGTPAYKLARERKPVEIAPVDVHVSEMELVSYADGLADVRLVCSSGFYVRAFAHDLGQHLGCGAHLEGLQRTRAGEFTLDQAVPLEAVVEGRRAFAEARAITMDRLLTHLPAVVVNASGAKRASHGNDLRPEDVHLAAPRVGGSLPAGSTSRVRLLDEAGALLGLAESRPNGLLHPVVVLV